jgi:cobalt-precorrin-5B (C1)-methyltransferase
MTTNDNGDDGPSRVRRKGLRTGYTTGACATAAALAATRALFTGKPVSSVTIHLPAGVDATFAVESCTFVESGVRCTVIKDAGDDPDVTHRAQIVATVRRQSEPGIALRGGPGVGVVTLPGLGLETGGPAINPVPRRMILDAVSSASIGHLGNDGLVVEISVPRGEELAKKTLNGRLGIVGGISILGTTGIVRPYSTASWRASVEQAIDVAAANGQKVIAITTGGRSERYAQQLLGLPEIALVEMGEFTGHSLKRARRRGIQQVYVCGMIGKLSKIAQGHLMTHVAGNQVDVAFLADLARQAGGTSEVQRAIATANTARGAQEIALAAGLKRFFELVAAAAADVCFRAIEGTMGIEVLLFDFDGALLGRKCLERGATMANEPA